MVQEHVLDVVGRQLMTLVQIGEAFFGEVLDGNSRLLTGTMENGTRGTGRRAGGLGLNISRGNNWFSFTLSERFYTGR